MIDANARVGASPDESIGSHAAEHEDAAGAFLRRLCNKFQLVIPQTWPHLVKAGQADHFTWVSKKGHSARIDYVAWPQQSTPILHGTRVAYDCEVSGGTLDHFPVVSAGTLFSIPSSASPKRRAHCCDYLRLGSPT
eukprot:11199770-Lingulodinium_polyedra.AAC.1